MGGDGKKVNYSLIITLAITLVGWGVTFGVCQNKIENNTNKIQRLEQQYDTVGTNFQNINTQLAGLNAKVDLLLDGRIITYQVSGEKINATQQN